MSIILVEGADGSGKSTLIENARANAEGKYFLKLRASRNQPDVQSALRLLSWLKSCPHDIVLDRFHFVSDRIYGPILRGANMLSAFPLAFGIQSMTAIVYCRPPLDKIKENVTKNKQLKGIVTNIDQIVVEYDRIMRAIQEMRLSTVFKYDYTEDEPVSFWRHVWSESVLIQTKRNSEMFGGAK